MVDRGVFTDIFNPLAFVDATVRTFALTKGPIDMGPSFVPHDGSVICGRGKECYNHVGNRRFRVLCEAHLDRYRAARTKVEKSQIVTTIVDAVRANRSGAHEEHGGGGGDGVGAFVARDTKSNRWMDVGDDAAREKTGQQLRDLMTRSKGSEHEPAASGDRSTVPTSTLPSIQASRKRSAEGDDPWSPIRRNRYDPQGTTAPASVDVKSISPTPSSSCSTASLTPAQSSSSRAFGTVSVEARSTSVVAAPPVLAPAVSLGAPHDDSTQAKGYHSFAMPASRLHSTREAASTTTAVAAASPKEDADSPVPFWNSPLGVAADLRDLFDHGEDDDSDGGEAGDDDSDDDAHDDAEERRDPLVGVRVPQL